MAERWEENLAGLSPEVAKERRRVLKLIQAHESSFDETNAGGLYIRLMNIISGGLDLDEEMKLPIEERAMFFNWPDDDGDEEYGEAND